MRGEGFFFFFFLDMRSRRKRIDERDGSVWSFGEGVFDQGGAGEGRMEVEKKKTDTEGDRHRLRTE